MNGVAAHERKPVMKRRTLRREGQQCRSVLLSCVEDGLARHTVEGILVAQRGEKVIVPSVDGRAENMADTFCALGDAHA
jgi:hypothetical protein